MSRRHRYAAAAGLLEQCRRRGDDERALWRALVRYRLLGAAGLLTADRPRRTIFAQQDALAREPLLAVLINTPNGVLGEFELPTSGSSTPTSSPMTSSTERTRTAVAAPLSGAPT